MASAAGLRGAGALDVASPPIRSASKSVSSASITLPVLGAPLPPPPWITILGTTSTRAASMASAKRLITCCVSWKRGPPYARTCSSMAIANARRSLGLGAGERLHLLGLALAENADLLGLGLSQGLDLRSLLLGACVIGLALVGLDRDRQLRLRERGLLLGARLRLT